MRTYFGINRRFSRGVFKLTMDYSLDEVSDTLALNRPKPAPNGFLDKFSYCRSGSDEVEDMVANNLGWLIVSERIANVLKNSNNANEIELLALPEIFWFLPKATLEKRVRRVVAPFQLTLKRPGW